MKAVSFLSVAFMATSALAAPFQGETRSVEASTKQVQRSAGEAASNGVAPVARAEKRDITDLESLISSLTSAQDGASGPLSILEGLTDSFNAGDIPSGDVAAQATPQLEEIEEVLKNLVEELTTAAGLNVRDSDLDTVVSLVNVLLGQVLTAVSGIVAITGLTPVLNSLVASVLGLVAKIVTLLIGLLAGLLPGLVAGLSPLLAGLGNGLLVPLLAPIAAALAGLQLPGVPIALPTN